MVENLVREAIEKAGGFDRMIRPGDRVLLNWGATGGGKYKIYEFEKFAPQIWKVKFGDGTIEFPKDPRNYLSRMDLGKCMAGYWLKQRYKYSLAPK